MTSEPPVPENGYVYILGAVSGTRYLTYVGWTLDLERRLLEHNQSPKGAKSTKGRVWQLLYAEKLPSRNAAMRREVYLKRDRAFRKRIAQGAQGC